MSNESADCTTTELMVAAGARELRDGQVVFAGLGMPQYAIVLAKRTHAPRLCVLNALGCLDPRTDPHEVGIGNADPRHWAGAASFGGFLDGVGMLLHRGLVDVGFLGALEIDPFGNVNSTQVRREDGGIRFFGGGGAANDVASHARTTIVIVRHEPRRLVERLAHYTSPGFLGSRDARQRAGLPGGGPSRLITDKAVFGFDEVTGAVRLLSLHPGVTPEEIVDATGFSVIVPPNCPTTSPPTGKQLRVMRDELELGRKLAGA
ncbi:MAG: glutaconate CoA-transferase, subunit [Chloroflexota bacterium]|nr:glutaconate CoA-transferase, subunit [Chloroflexota bacterium]